MTIGVREGIDDFRQGAKMSTLGWLGTSRMPGQLVEF